MAYINGVLGDREAAWLLPWRTHYRERSIVLPDVGDNEVDVEQSAKSRHVLSIESDLRDRDPMPAPRNDRRTSPAAAASWLEPRLLECHRVNG